MGAVPIRLFCCSADIQVFILLICWLWIHCFESLWFFLLNEDNWNPFQPLCLRFLAQFSVQMKVCVRMCNNPTQWVLIKCIQCARERTSLFEVDIGWELSKRRFWLLDCLTYSIAQFWHTSDAHWWLSIHNNCMYCVSQRFLEDAAQCTAEFARKVRIKLVVPPKPDITEELYLGEA